MREYYYYSPRGFANEYTIFAVVTGTEDAKRLVSWLDNESNNVNTTYDKISEKDALDYAVGRKRRAKAWGEETFGGIAGCWDPTMSTDANFQAAVEETSLFLDRVGA